MKRSTVLMLSSALIIIVCTSVVTTKLLAQRKETPASAPVEEAVRKPEPKPTFKKAKLTKEEFDALRAKQAANPQPKRSPTSYGGGHMNQMRLEQTPKGIDVKTSIVMYDQRPEHFYIWTLSVRDESGKEVWGKTYNHRIVNMPNNEEIEFAELVPVTKTQLYKVEVVMWDYSPHLDYARLRTKRTEQEEAWIRGSRFEKIDCFYGLTDEYRKTLKP